MKVRFHKNFDKLFRKLRPAEKQRAIGRLQIFVVRPSDPILNNHALKGKYQGLYSINITGDLRAIYSLVKKDTALFLVIGTHSYLYK